MEYSIWKLEIDCDLNLNKCWYKNHYFFVYRFINSDYNQWVVSSGCSWLTEKKIIQRQFQMLCWGFWNCFEWRQQREMGNSGFSYLCLKISNTTKCTLSAAGASEGIVVLTSVVKLFPVFRTKRIARRIAHYKWNLFFQLLILSGRSSLRKYYIRWNLE